MAIKESYKIQRTGDNVSELLDKIEALGPATHTVAGIMTALDKAKLDSLGIQYGTTAYWNSRRGYIPKAGEIIIYSDYKSVNIDGHRVYIPGIKVGTGNGYVQDLIFATDVESADISAHIQDTSIHTGPEEKLFWNNKLNVDDYQEVVGESLILNRN